MVLPKWYIRDSYKVHEHKTLHGGSGENLERNGDGI